MITSRVDLAMSMSVCPSVHMNAKILETIEAKNLFNAHICLPRMY